MIRYRVKLAADDNGTILVTAPDFPDVVTFGKNREDALHHAVGAFREIIAARIHDKEAIPAPSKIRAKDDFITLPVQTEMKVRMYESMRDAGVRKADLARKLNLHRQEIDRLLDFEHATRLDRIESAFAALGKQLKIEVADAS